MSDPDILPGEALFGFAAWLTTRDEPVTFSSRHDAGEAVRLIREFCWRYGISEEVRDDRWPGVLKEPHPLERLARCAED